MAGSACHHPHGAQSRLPGPVPPRLARETPIAAETFTIDGVEYHRQIGFLKGGLALADCITTVSPTYALEIQGGETGMGLDGCCAIAPMC